MSDEFRAIEKWAEDLQSELDAVPPTRFLQETWSVTNVRGKNGKLRRQISFHGATVIAVGHCDLRAWLSTVSEFDMAVLYANENLVASHYPEGCLDLIYSLPFGPGLKHK
jgi:hypothetical protein